MSAAVPPHVAARHHALAPEHVDAPHRWWEAGDLLLESGARVERCGVSWVEHGIEDPGGERTILGCTAIGATHHRLDFLIGPGRALDTTRFRIVVVDALGNGLSTSPSNSATQAGPGFPRFTIGDMVAAQHRLLVERLGLRRVHAVIGASMGGMQALEWGVRHPGFCARIVAMTPMARTAPWARAINEAARRALMGDPAFAGGRYDAQPGARHHGQGRRALPVRGRRGGRVRHRLRLPLALGQRPLDRLRRERHGRGPQPAIRGQAPLRGPVMPVPVLNAPRPFGPHGVCLAPASTWATRRCSPAHGQSQVRPVL